MRLASSGTTESSWALAGATEKRATTPASRPCVHPEAVEGLPEEGVLAEGGLSPEALAAVGPGEQARRQGERVHQGEAGVVRGFFGQEVLPKALLNLPEVRRLPGEGGAMHPPEVREEVGVVAPEVRKELRVFVYPQELADEPMVSTSDRRARGVRALAISLGLRYGRRRPKTARKV